MCNWIDIKHFEGRYQVSDAGQVKSLINDIILKPQSSYHKYLRVMLYLNGKGQWRYIHRLVAFPFVPNPDNKKEVGHLDYDKHNNASYNLKWTTRKENMQEMHEHYRKKKEEKNTEELEAAPF